MLHNLYVDDSVSSFDKLNDCLKFYKVSKSCLTDAGLYLPKWKSNDSRFENYINSITCANSTDDVNLDNPSLILSKICSVNCSSTKVLGLNWDTTSDKFIFNSDYIFSTAVNLPVTKRNILKISSTFFDPLGFIIPITLPAKVLYRDICLEKYSWDSEIRCNYIQKRWMRYLNELNTLSKVSVNRHVLCCDCRIFDIYEFVIVLEKPIVQLYLQGCHVAMVFQ